MDPGLKVRIRRKDSIPILDLVGDVDTYNCSKLREAIMQLIDDGDFRVVIDMSAVNYIDSTGLGTLVGSLKRMSEQNGELAIMKTNPRVRKVLDITGLNRVLPLFETESEAVQSLLAEKLIAADTSAVLSKPT